MTDDMVEKYREKSRNTPSMHLSDYFADRAAEISRKNEKESEDLADKTVRGENE